MFLEIIPLEHNIKLLPSKERPTSQFCESTSKKSQIDCMTKFSKLSGTVVSGTSNVLQKIKKKHWKQIKKKVRTLTRAKEIYLGSQRNRQNYLLKINIYDLIFFYLVLEIDLVQQLAQKFYNQLNKRIFL
jgi:hypothetical protein